MIGFRIVLLQKYIYIYIYIYIRIYLYVFNIKYFIPYTLMNI